VFDQMDMEVDVDMWKACVIMACEHGLLAIGSAHVDKLKDALGCSDRGILRSKKVEEAHVVLATGVCLPVCCAMVSEYCELFQLYLSLNAQRNLPQQRHCWQVFASGEQVSLSTTCFFS
jgi:hypothetical protein